MNRYADRELLSNIDILTPESTRILSKDFWQTMSDLADNASHMARVATMAKLVMLAEHDEEAVPRGMANLMNQLRKLLSQEP